MTESWTDAPMVFIPAVACPDCRAVKPIIIRSTRENDGSTTRRCVCRRCSVRFLAIIEPPEEIEEPLPKIGNDESDVW